MPEVIELRDYTCPKCRETARLDGRFIQWCTACGHNVDPQPPQLGKREQRRAAREYQRSRRLFESLRTAESLRPTSATGVSVTLLSGVVHLISLAVLALPILYILVSGGGFWSAGLLVFCLLTFWTIRPRLFRSGPDPSEGLDRVKAPEFYELLDRCAAELGCSVPEQVYLSQEFNAATGRSGLSRRSYLILGVPLWTVLSGSERIALLGHELAHQVNGDTTHGLWASSARRSLYEWTRLLDPRQTAFEHRSNQRIARRVGRRGGLAAILAPVIMAIAFAPLFAVAFGCQVLLKRLDLYCGQRAEYLADELGARLAGSEAAHGLLAKLALAEPTRIFLVAARNRNRLKRDDGDAAVLWARMTEYVDSVPETEIRRRTIVDRLHNTRTDSSHPAHHLRSALIEVRPPLPGLLKLSEDEWSAIDAELAAESLAVARGLLKS